MKTPYSDFSSAKEPSFLKVVSYTRVYSTLSTLIHVNTCKDMSCSGWTCRNQVHPGSTLSTLHMSARGAP